MGLSFLQVPESRSEEARQFLMQIFQCAADAPSFTKLQMQWKYWEPRTDWPGSRSYALADDSGAFVAEVGVWPFELRTTEAVIPGLHPIDWVAAPKARGAGMQLLREVSKLRGVSFCIGGTDIAKATVRRAGFQSVRQMYMLACPLRPLRQALTHQWRNWKLPLRFARNAMWAARAATPPPGWTADAIAPEHLPADVLPQAKSNLMVVTRTPELFAYFERCPGARFRLWLVKKDDRPCGYFCLSFVPGQVRIADAWVSTQDLSSWHSLYALAMQAALAQGSAAEILTGVTYNLAHQAALAAGFRSVGQEDVMAYDPSGYFSPSVEVHLQVMENDISCLHAGRIEYVT